MEFTSENVEKICTSTKECVANISNVVEIIATATGKPGVKAELITTIVNGTLEAIKPIICAIADAKNGKCIVPEMNKLVEQLERLKSMKDLPTT